VTDVSETLDPLFADLRARISEIKVALVGSMTSRGLLHDVDLINARVDSLSLKVEELDAALVRQNSIVAQAPPSTVVEIVKILASPSGVAVVFLLVAALAILIGGGLGQATNVRDIPIPTPHQAPHQVAPGSEASPALLESMSDEDRAALKVRVLQELDGLLRDVDT
jgi:hypothetical protein